MQLTEKTLELYKGAFAKGTDMLAKAGYTQSSGATSGITNYDLRGPALTMFPMDTPLRNIIPRVVGGLGIQANWRAQTGVNKLGLTAGVSQGQRNAAMTSATQDYTAAFKTLSMEQFVNFQADWAAEGFDDLRARALNDALFGLMIQEELTDLGGNSSLALGITPTPTVSDVTTGGTLLANTTYNVFCVAMNQRGYNALEGTNNGTWGQNEAITAADAIKQTVTRANMDGTTDVVNMGYGQKSAAGSVTTANDASNTHALACSVAYVNGAAGYAWFWGVAGQEKLGAVTHVNHIKITAAAAGLQNISALVAADYSRDSLVYDGILTQLLTSGSGAYVSTLATGTPGTGNTLTSDGGGGCVEIDNVLQGMYANARVRPSRLIMSARTFKELNTVLIKNGNSPLVRFPSTNGGEGLITSGRIDSYMNKITGDMLKIVVHPNMSEGQILVWSDRVPFPTANSGILVQKLLRRDYFATEWPLRTMRYEHAASFDGVLQCFFPPAFGVLQNIAVPLS